MPWIEPCLTVQQIDQYRAYMRTVFKSCPETAALFPPVGCRAPSFDRAQSQSRKRQGMLLAEQNKSVLLERARAIAVDLGKKQRYVTADDVGKEMQYRSMGELGPAAGSLFKTSDWVFTGRRIQSDRRSNHARELKVWEYVGAKEKPPSGGEDGGVIHAF